MNEETQKRVMDTLEALAAKLGTTGEALWEVLLRQATVDAVLACLYAAFGLGLTSLAVWFACKLSLGAYEGHNNEGKLVTATTTAVGGGAVGPIVFFVNLHTVITGFYNPEFLALKQILEALK